MSALHSACPDTILVADDDEYMLDAMAHYLKQAGYDVIKAGNGKESVDLFIEHEPSLLLLDANMPKMDGFHACRLVKEIANGKDVPVVLVTSQEDEDSINRAFESGAQEYITKPINWAVLHQRIRLLLRQQKNLHIIHEHLKIIRERDERIKLFMHKAPVAIAMFDEQMRYLHASQKWLDDFGLVHQSVIHQCHYDLLPNDIKYWRDIHQRCLNGAWERHDADPIEDRNGRVQWSRWEAFPWQKEDGKTGGVMMFTENITQQKELEDEIKKHRDHLSCEREIIEEIIVRMRTNEEFDSRSLHFLQSPVEHTTGDLLLSAFRSDGSQHVFLGDFTGHGLPAAVGGALVADIFYSMTEQNIPLAEIVNEINAMLTKKTPVNMFMAAGSLEISPDRRMLTVWNCTIPDILVFRKGRLLHRLGSKCFPLGVLNRPVCSGQTVDLQPGDRIFAFTDGWVEERDAEGNMFGQEKMEKLLSQMINRNESLEMLENALRGYRAGKGQSDDMTVVGIEC
ncbi:MAG: SpoIIE family protein phosphatase [Magnetococcales bacterium]|nr:SpoIIE family protein phosphatase [Magnetococcales bacterium]